MYRLSLSYSCTRVQRFLGFSHFPLFFITLMLKMSNFCFPSQSFLSSRMFIYIYFFPVLFCRLLYVVRIVQYFCILLHAMCIWPLTDFASVNITIYLSIHTYIYGLNVKYLFYIPISLKISLSLSLSPCVVYCVGSYI